jgi:hypothetical protein
MHKPSLYSRTDWAVLWYVAGLLTGTFIGFTACTPDTTTQEPQ